VRESGAGYLLFGLVFLSGVLVTIDFSTRLLDPLRGGIATIVSPFYVVAESPYFLSGAIGDVLSTRDQLQRRNEQLQDEILSLSQMAQQAISLRAENDRLRALLGSQSRLSDEVLIAELVGVVPDPNRFQIIVNKGSLDGVQNGQAVIDAQGLFGQVVEVSRSTSRVLLLVDRNHAVPVRINRNGVRSIAGGTGDVDGLVLENVPTSADIVPGDLVETSGLGGRFPPGYPVGEVESVLVEPTSSYAQVRLRPTALIDRSRHVLIIFSSTPWEGEPQVSGSIASDAPAAGPDTEPGVSP